MQAARIEAQPAGKPPFLERTRQIATGIADRLFGPIQFGV